jgi:hypothetical protein
MAWYFVRPKDNFTFDCTGIFRNSLCMYVLSLSLGVKWPGHEADHSPPFSAEVKNAWSYTSTPPIRFMAL